MVKLNSIDYDIGYPIYGAKFLNDKTLLVTGGGGEGNREISNRLTALTINPSKKKKPIKKFRELKLNDQNDAPSVLDSNNNIILLGCNEGQASIENGHNHNLQKFIYINDHLKYVTSTSLEQEVSKSIYQKFITLSPNGSIAAIASSKLPTVIHILDPVNLFEKYEIETNNDVKDLDISPDGKNLTYITKTNTIEIISIITGRSLLRRIEFNENFNLNKVKFLDNDHVILGVSLKNGAGISLLKLSLSSKLKTVKEVQVSKKIKTITSIDVNLKNGVIAMSGNDNSIILLKAQSLKQIKSFSNVHALSITKLTFSPNGSFLASVSVANTVNIIEITDALGIETHHIYNFFKRSFQLLILAIVVQLGWKYYQNREINQKGLDLSEYFTLNQRTVTQGPTAITTSTGIHEPITTATSSFVKEVEDEPENTSTESIGQPVETTTETNTVVEFSSTTETSTELQTASTTETSISTSAFTIEKISASTSTESITLTPSSAAKPTESTEFPTIDHQFQDGETPPENKYGSISINPSISTTTTGPVTVTSDQVSSSSISKKKKKKLKTKTKKAKKRSKTLATTLRDANEKISLTSDVVIPTSSLSYTQTSPSSGVVSTGSLSSLTSSAPSGGAGNGVGSTSESLLSDTTSEIVSNTSPLDPKITTTPESILNAIDSLTSKLASKLNEAVKSESSESESVVTTEDRAVSSSLIGSKTATESIATTTTPLTTGISYPIEKIIDTQSSSTTSLTSSSTPSAQPQPSDTPSSSGVAGTSPLESEISTPFDPEVVETQTLEELPSETKEPVEIIAEEGMNVDAEPVVEVEDAVIPDTAKEELAETTGESEASEVLETTDIGKTTQTVEPKTYEEENDADTEDSDTEEVSTDEEEEESSDENYETAPEEELSDDENYETAEEEQVSSDEEGAGDEATEVASSISSGDEAYETAEDSVTSSAEDNKPETEEITITETKPIKTDPIEEPEVVLEGEDDSETEEIESSEEEGEVSTDEEGDASAEYETASGGEEDDDEEGDSSAEYETASDEEDDEEETTPDVESESGTEAEEESASDVESGSEAEEVSEEVSEVHITTTAIDLHDEL